MPRLPNEPRAPKTYANYLRTTPAERLTKAERKVLQEDRDWCTENPELVQALEAMLDKTVQMARNMKSLGSPTTYPIGTRFRVIGRWKGCLHVCTDRNLVLEVRPEWVTVVEEPEAKKTEPKKAAWY